LERLVKERIDAGAVLSAVQHPSCGGSVLFVGTVRKKSEAGRVDLIHYEAYEPMAERKLREIEEDVSEAWPQCRVRLIHRLGVLKVGEVSVAVAVSAPHRAEAFEACRLAIERIKREVPIWKKERLADGKEVWVEGHRVETPKPRRGPGRRSSR
jgi:molybdopterin synthase catalytic subunit